MKRLALLVIVVLSTIASGMPVSAAPEITANTVIAVQGWVDAVRTHVPGRRDGPLVNIVRESFEGRSDLAGGMNLFLASLLGKSVVTQTGLERRIAEIGRDARNAPGADAFLRRAAVLHADAAMSAEPVTPDPRPAPPRGAQGMGPAAALLSSRQLFLDNDGEIVGRRLANWNWPFARSLLDLIAPKPADDPFVGTWYHATTAFMLKNGQYGEAVTHLTRAAEVLPDDARVLFDRACYSEQQGLPVSQVLLSDEDIIALRAPTGGLGRRTFSPGQQLGIPPEDKANDEAEHLFRRALNVDPDFVEARVRLARLLDVRKRHDEAASELKTALEAHSSPGPVAFYAHLFAGRAAQALGRMDEASDHYAKALTLFPRAQSALLAQSQAALLASDVAGALAPIDRLAAPASVSRADDPWWVYHFGAGRDSDALLREMWAEVSR